MHYYTTWRHVLPELLEVWLRKTLRLIDVELQKGGSVIFGMGGSPGTALHPGDTPVRLLGWAKAFIRGQRSAVARTPDTYMHTHTCWEGRIMVNRQQSITHFLHLLPSLSVSASLSAPFHSRLPPLFFFSFFWGVKFIFNWSPCNTY